MTGFVLSLHFTFQLLSHNPLLTLPSHLLFFPFHTLLSSLPSSFFPLPPLSPSPYPDGVDSVPESNQPPSPRRLAGQSPNPTQSPTAPTSSSSGSTSNTTSVPPQLRGLLGSCNDTDTNFLGGFVSVRRVKGTHLFIPPSLLRYPFFSFSLFSYSIISRSSL